MRKNLRNLNLVESGGKMKFTDFGFESSNDFINYFLSTLLNSSKTYDYFVNWDKVKENVSKYKEEIYILNSLSREKDDEIKSKLSSIICKYPKVVEVIPVLIAERLENGKIELIDLEKDLKPIEFNLSETYITSESKEEERCKKAEEISTFCFKVGIVSLLKEVKDLYDYLLGVEVGIDTNARKNRSGEVFEEICKKKIEKCINELNKSNNVTFEVKKNDPNFSLEHQFKERGNKGKKHDFVIYRNNFPVLVIECSFYNVAGSKPISISESYVEMNNKAKNLGLFFLWLTDGPAWKDMKDTLEKSLQKLDFVFNYRMLTCENLQKILHYTIEKLI